MATIRNNQKPLSEVEWDTCWMAVRYAMGRMTIASATLPRQLLRAYHERFSDNQKSLLVKDLREYLDSHECFGMREIDHPEWAKFMLTLDESTHYKVVGNIGSKEPFDVFDFDEKIIPVKWYKHVGDVSIVETAIKKVE